VSGRQIQTPASRASGEGLMILLRQVDKRLQAHRLRGAEKSSAATTRGSQLARHDGSGGVSRKDDDESNLGGREILSPMRALRGLTMMSGRSRIRPIYSHSLLWRRSSRSATADSSQSSKRSQCPVGTSELSYDAHATAEESSSVRERRSARMQ
jgi:hypothetical protein